MYMLARTDPALVDGKDVLLSNTWIAVTLNLNVNRSLREQCSSRRCEQVTEDTDEYRTVREYWALVSAGSHRLK